MIDIHSHILEGVDDGSKNLEYSLEMARIAYMSGTRHIIATPHYIENYYEVPYTEIKDKVRILNKNLKQQQINVRIYPGQEVRLDQKTAMKFIKGEIGTLNETDYMLIELGESITSKELTWIDELKALGIKPIIAHIERYREIYKHKKLLNELIKRECYMQCNVNGLNGVDGKKTAQWAQQLIVLGCIHLIASDAHSIGRRNPEMESGFEVLKDRGLIDEIRQNARCVLEGRMIPYRTRQVPEQKRLFERRK